MDIISLLNLNRAEPDGVFKNREQAAETERQDAERPARRPPREVTDASQPTER